ncbi:trehalose operon repressor [Paenibacillus jamilae]|uniref:trehalose operon repressor n=1 Tax=Paenibacillus TaxID=44249 RepID=UPI0004DA875E|nr:trehalose operon repressor [Paenibacillus polymyxa]KEO79812.1 trehalose operon transcriptional repressor [Paenibacillus polymyxa]KYG93865.1 trehalose operon repressor [Paenibacillus polymyxa]MCH6188374.1 trehalose operon repressor [Paenibacillus polymyxa]WRL61265.1 trehalose operon repressor [Paenibacillus polymyxa]
MTKNIFLQIYQDYSGQIQTGELAPGTKMPSENELAREYNTSRETVRKALHLLAQNGYIHKIKAKGSFVLDIGRMDFPIGGLVSFKEMSERIGRTSRTIVHENQLIPVPDDIANHLEIDKDKYLVWKVIRAREIEGECVILDKDYFRSDIVPVLTEEISRGSIYEYLEGELHLQISYAKKVVSVENADEEDHRLMDLQNYTHVVVVRNYVYLEDTTLFQYTESRHRLDKFQFIDFARRSHGEDKKADFLK